MGALRRSLAILSIAMPAASATLTGCEGDIVDPDVCDDESPPAAPAIIGLGPRPDFVVPDELDIGVSALVDADGDPQVGLEVEIWTRNPDGTARERVWFGAVSGPSRRNVRLADGRYENIAAFLGGLEDWREHLVRARYLVQPPGSDCVSAGAWSAKLDFTTDDGSSAIFAPGLVRDYHVDLPPASVSSINAEAIPPGCVPYQRNYYEGTFRDVTRSFAGVGVKAKGGCGSARTLDRKTALKIHLGWDSPQVAGCPASRRLDGLERFTFNNMVQDGTMAHELMAYALYERMGVPVPRATFARLHVNDVYYGLYLNVESVDRRVLARRFGSNRGALYEGTYWCDLIASNVADDDSGCLVRTFEDDPCDSPPEPGDDPRDYTPLRALIASLDALPAGGFYPAIGNHLDFETFLSMWAVDTVLAHWDGYLFNLRNNYRIYHDPSTNRWTIIPSGLDQTMQLRHVDDTLLDVQGRLGQRCLAEPACAAAFGTRVRQALDVFGQLNMPSRRQDLQVHVNTLMTPDPGREFDPARFASEHASTQQFIEQRPAIVLQALTARGI